MKNLRRKKKNQLSRVWKYQPACNPISGEKLKMFLVQCDKNSYNDILNDTCILRIRKCKMLILKLFFNSLQIVKLGSTLVSKHVISSSTKEYE